jgi:hypothetical protein
LVSFSALLSFLAVGVGDALFRVDRQRQDLVRRFLGHRLDVHAAFCRHDEGRTADGAVDQDRQIEFALDVGAVLDIEAVDLLAGRAGLLGHQRVAEHFPGVLDDFLDRERQPHAALGVLAEFLELALAASAGMDLAFDHVERSGQRFRPFFRLLGGVDGDAPATGAPYSCSSRLAWYSWMFMGTPSCLDVSLSLITL